MRSSKSNPAKYARNYRKISQRKMTEQEMDVEKGEIERLRELLRTSSEHISKNDPHEENNKKRKRNRKGGSGGDDVKDSQSNGIELEGDAKEDKIQYTTDDTALILPSRKKKVPKKKVIELTPEELKAAKAKHKAMQRKLNQIEERHERKKRRKELYATLSEHALSETEMQLLEKSAHLGKKVTKKEALKRLLQKERAGVDLTEEEKEVLYTNTERDEEAFDQHFGTDDGKSDVLLNNDKEQINEDEVVPLEFSSGKRKKKQKKKSKEKHSDSLEREEKDIVEEGSAEKEEEGLNDKMPSAAVVEPKEAVPEKAKVENTGDKPKLSFAAQMMAGLTTLKTSAAEKKKELDEINAREKAELEEKKRQEEEEERKKRRAYVPTNPSVLKSAAVMGLKPKEGEGKNAWRVLQVERPQEVDAKRYDLPVSTKEYEIIDSIRNNSVTIICSETGSGKSTQVPQFLYESGFTLGNAKVKGEDDGLLICVTQPRRVAAISTAKRVCYEMGYSNDGGQTIQGRKGKGNTVAYQTKYESAGLRSNTRIKFMTDGILLQEIKSDLLLRKYAGKIIQQFCTFNFVAFSEQEIQLDHHSNLP